MNVDRETDLDRRQFVFNTTGTAALLALTPAAALAGTATEKASPNSAYAWLYKAKPRERFPLPAIDLKRVEEEFLRRRVLYHTTERPGTVVVDTKEKFLYLVLNDGTAIRYGVGLGRQGYSWTGRATIGWKQRWPTWTPPDEMVKRQPNLRKWSAGNGGMPPGPKNPLGARALYIIKDGKDTLYRIHGTPEYWTIGKSVSSGCVRMINQDVVDLYSRVRRKAEIVVA